MLLHGRFIRFLKRLNIKDLIIGNLDPIFLQSLKQMVNGGHIDVEGEIDEDELMSIREEGIAETGEKLAEKDQEFILVVEEPEVFFCPAELKLILRLGQRVRIA